MLGSPSQIIRERERERERERGEEGGWGVEEKRDTHSYTIKRVKRSVRNTGHSIKLVDNTSYIYLPGREAPPNTQSCTGH